MVNIQKLRGKMAEQGVTQKALADYMKLSENTMSSRFQGKSSFTLEDVDAICEFLKVETAEEKVEIFLP